MENILTVDEAAKQRGHKVYDCALPQQWVDEQIVGGFDPRAHFVWCYDVCKIFGEPSPITKEGEEWVELVEGYDKLIESLDAMRKQKPMTFEEWIDHPETVTEAEMWGACDEQTGQDE